MVEFVTVDSDLPVEVQVRIGDPLKSHDSELLGSTDSEQKRLPRLDQLVISYLA